MNNLLLNNIYKNMLVGLHYEWRAWLNYLGLQEVGCWFLYIYIYPAEQHVGRRGRAPDEACNAFGECVTPKLRMCTTRNKVSRRIRMRNRASFPTESSDGECGRVEAPFEAWLVALDSYWRYSSNGGVIYFDKNNFEMIIASGSDFKVHFDCLTTFKHHQWSIHKFKTVLHDLTCLPMFYWMNI